MKRSIPEGIRVRRSILHPYYRVHPGGHGYETYTEKGGINTALLVDRFKAGESIDEISSDYELWEEHVEIALRWEMLSPYLRKKLVMKAVQDGKV